MSIDLPMLRTSERRAFRRCPQRWQWGWLDGLKPRETAKALWFGSGIHNALEHHYCGPGEKRGKDPIKVWRDYVADETVNVITADDAIVDAKLLGETMLAHYLEVYGADEHMFIIEPEYSFEIPIPHPSGNGHIVLYCGTADLVWRDQNDNTIWLEEHKTAKAIKTGHLPLDDQAGSYWAVMTKVLREAGKIGPKERLKGIEYNFLRKGVKPDRPQDENGHYHNKPTKAHYMAELDRFGIPYTKRTVEHLQALADEHGLTVLGDISKNQPPPLLHREKVLRTPKESLSQIERIQKESVVMAGMREGTIPIYKNTTKDCQYDCGFYEMCTIHEAKQDWEEFRDLAMRVEDPYANHREKSTEE